MPKLNFKPTYYLTITYFCSLGIALIDENGDTVVISAYFDEHGNQSTRASKSTVRVDRKGHPYFMKSRQRFYLNDFIKKSPF